MWKDSIIKEVRKAGEELAKQANYNIHTFFQNLRKNEKKRVSKMSVKITLSGSANEPEAHASTSG